MSDRLILKIGSTVILTLVSIIGFFIIFGCSYVGPGNVGIVVKLYGGERGVQDTSVDTGYIWYNRWTTQVYEYPIYVQRAVFTADKNEDSPLDESITFNSKEGMSVRADIGLHYEIQSDGATKVFTKLRGDATAVRNYLKSKMRDAINSVASSMSINDIYGEGKVRLLKMSQESLQTSIGPEIKIEMLTFVNSLVLDNRVQESINLTIQAQQAAVAAQNKVAQAKAEADQKIEEARGRAESLLIEATKQAEANITVSKSLTPELVNWQAIQKWDGKLPQVSGSQGVPFIQLK